MFKTYLKFSIRNMLNNKTYSTINIVGLTVGLTITILILVWVQHQVSFDRFHKNSDRIYHVFRRGINDSPDEGSDITPGPAAKDLKAEFLEIEEAATGGFGGNILVRYKDNMFVENQVRGVTPSFLKIFTYPLLEGDPNTALEQPHSIIITEKAAKKYFGDKEPLGKTLQLNNEHDFLVTGVAENCPSNSLMQFEFLVPFAAIPDLTDDVAGDIDRYSNSAYYTFVLLNKNIEVDEVNQKLAQFSKAREDEIYYLEPFTRVYLYKYGVINLVILLSTIAFLIFISSCINYINISSARSISRYKEIGIQKMCGASRWQVFLKFMHESALYAGIAIILAIVFVQFLLPFLRLATRQALTINFARIPFIISMAVIFCMTMIFAGVYPALMLSRPQPSAILRGVYHKGKTGAWLRKALIVVQFFFSIIFIICTSVLYKQGLFFQTLDLGFSKANIAYIPMHGGLARKHDILREKLQQHPNIQAVTASNLLPLDMTNNTDGWGLPDQQKKINAKYAWVDYDYLETFSMQMAQGRFYSRQFPSDEAQAIVLNESAVEQLGMENPVGATINFWGQPYTLIGVIKDFQNVQLGYKSQPQILRLNPGKADIMFMKIRSNAIESTLPDIQRICDELSSNYPQDILFLEDFHYRMEDIGNAINQLLLYFTLLALLLSSLGLYGLSTYMAEQRTKEIGIRKVLGATVFDVLRLLWREFGMLLVIANIIAWPLAYFISNGLLQNFAERIHVGPGFFLFAGGTTLCIAVLSVSWQAIRAAVSDPVESLRYE
ncbi:ABC transporter permease [candidate division KSB1 bacterium]|nr:ABC transporter permease [candidate division KSB1 bacterium]